MNPCPNEKYLPLFLPVFCLLLLLSGCVLTREPPFILSSPECKIGRQTGYYLFAGIEFDVYNSSGKDISRLHISCMVYDADKKENPFVGSNLIRVSFAGSIPNQTQKKLVINLDSYIHAVPGKPYLVDFFYISKVEFSDGSSWSDPTGAYHTRSY